MTTKQTIDGVPRDRLISGDLLERLTNAASIRAHGEALDELCALLDAKPVMCHGCMAEGVSPDHFDSSGKCKSGQPRGEPVAWLYERPLHVGAQIPNVLCIERAHPDDLEGWIEKPLYADQPAPVAVLLPERRQIDEGASDADQHSDYGWNACLDEVTRLNKKE